MKNGPRAEDENSDAAPEDLRSATDIRIGNDGCAGWREGAERLEDSHGIIACGLLKPKEELNFKARRLAKG